MPIVDETSVRSFANTFFGYGSWSAPTWFVGMEEGGLKTIEEFGARIRAWNDLGRPELADLFLFHRAFGATGLFEAKAPLQKTWRPLIRAVQVADGRDTSTAALRDYQVTRLGRAGGETAIIELLPFPSSSTRDWIYGSLGVPDFATRKCYTEHLMGPRFQLVLKHIEHHQPRAVVFFGYPRFWARQLSLEPHTLGIHIGAIEHTRLIAAPHPTAHGTSNARWDEIGRLVGLVAEQ